MEVECSCHFLSIGSDNMIPHQGSTTISTKIVHTAVASTGHCYLWTRFYILLNFMVVHVNCIRNVVLLYSGAQKFVANFLGYCVTSGQEICQQSALFFP